MKLKMLFTIGLIMLVAGILVAFTFPNLEDLGVIIGFVGVSLIVIVAITKYLSVPEDKPTAKTSHKKLD